MTKKLRNILLGLFSFAAMVAICLSVVFSSSAITVEAQDAKFFEMVNGAGIRVTDPTGMRFKTKFSEDYYEELTAEGTSTQMFVSIFPYADYDKYDESGKDLAVWLDAYYGAGKYINIAMDSEKFYYVANDDCYYGNAVISNVNFNNYHREFVGVAYLRRGTAGNYTYEYTANAITQDNNARSVFEVAVKANMNAEDHAKYGDALETIIKNGLYGAYGVKYDKNAKTYSLNGATYTSLDEIEAVVNLDEATLSVADETLNSGESKQLAAAFTYADGTAFAKDAFFIYSSSNPNVATVDANGVVTAVAEGETTITVTACGGLYTATCTVTVASVQPIGVVIENTLYDPASDYVGTATNEVSAPAGFVNVHKFTEARSDADAFIHGGNYSAKCLTNYSFVTFAVKATNILVGAAGWITSNEWLVFELTQTGEALWTIEVYQNGNKIHTATNMSGNKDGGAYVYNALDSILFGVPSPEYYVGVANGAFTVYFTEVRGVEFPIDPVGTIVSDCAATLGSLQVGKNPLTATTEIAVPNGFEKLYKYEEDREAFHGGDFVSTNLTNYSLVTFAIKTGKFNFNNELWDESNEWLVFTLTQTSTAVWDLVVTKNGETIHTATGLSGNKDAGVYSYNALDSILYGIPSQGYTAWAVDGTTTTMYITELRGEKIPVEPVGKIIDECAYLVEEASFTATTEIANADGFEKLYKHVSAGANIHGMLFSGKNLDNYELVTFAIKTANFNMNSEGANESNEWLVFTLTQVSPDTWDLVVTCNGAVVYTKDGLNGAYNSAANPAYSDNALDAILYGNPSGFSPTGVNGELLVYVTELRGISNVVEPEVELIGEEISECAAMLGALDVGDQQFAATTEIAAPAGFGKVYKYVDKCEAFHGGNYSNVCLTDYPVVTFAVKATKMKLNGDWDESNEWLVFTMTQTSEAVWTVEVSKNGEVIHKTEGVAGTRDGGAYKYNALDSILYGGAPEFVAWNVGGTVTMYITELRGVLPEVNPQ